MSNSEEGTDMSNNIEIDVDMSEVYVNNGHIDDIDDRIASYKRLGARQSVRRERFAIAFDEMMQGPFYEGARADVLTSEICQGLQRLLQKGPPGSGVPGEAPYDSERA